MSDWLLFLGLWCAVALVLLAIYAGINWYAERRRVRRVIGARLAAIAGEMPMQYIGCWMCEGAAGLGVRSMVAHQLQVHGRTLPPERRRAAR
jgi:hypothetical protein